MNDDGWFDEDGPQVRVESMQVSVQPGSVCEVTEDNLDESATYLLFFGDHKYVIYEFEPDEEWDGWSRAAVATVELLNQLLAAHGSPKRAYGFYGGNDLHIAFVTAEMAHIINMAVGPRDRLHDGSNSHSEVDPLFPNDSPDAAGKAGQTE